MGEKKDMISSKGASDPPDPFDLMGAGIVYVKLVVEASNVAPT